MYVCSVSTNHYKDILQLLLFCLHMSVIPIKYAYAKTLAPGDRFTKVIVNRKSKITLKISLRARIRAFH